MKPLPKKRLNMKIKEDAGMNGEFESIEGRLLTANEKECCKKLIDEIRHKGFKRVMEKLHTPGLIALLPCGIWR